MRYVLIGDGESPHLLKWARALAAQPGIELWAASSRGFLAGFDAVIVPEHRLALETKPDAAGGNVALLRQLPRLAAWLHKVDATWIHAHYLSSHGTMAWLAQRVYGVRGRLVGSAWGSDILVAPQRSALMKSATRRVLRACALTTSDSQVMAARMRELGAREVMVFPFGLEAMPAEPGAKDDGLFYANRGLETIYAPQRVLDVFAALAWPDARLVVANDGSLRAALERAAPANVRFVGRLDESAQAGWYARARWYLSLPTSDSVSVSVIEAMAQGCIPILSDLPANRELVRDGQNGIILADGKGLEPARLRTLLARGDAIAAANRIWVREHALFAPCVRAFVERLKALPA
ncbi:MAG: glycosyl transferase family 1 [Lysobacteraceae bacterium SCN 69-25]|nr:MAG: glycosyl transferase family 1 [Xanthomonadaceae bacterium SCN 69-25]